MDVDPHNIAFSYRPLGNTGRVQMKVTCGNEKFTHKFDVTEAGARAKFSDRLVARFPAIASDQVAAHLERIASELAEREMEAEEEGTSDGDSDDVVVLIELATDMELFHCGERHDAEPYARIKVGEHYENWPIRSSGYGHLLRLAFHRLRGRAPGSQDFSDAIATIVSKALYDGAPYPVFVRMAEHEGVLYVDLADADWRAIRITPSEWSVVSGNEIPVRFVRRRGMQALPEPVRGGSIQELRRFVNVAGDDQFCLLTCSLVAMFRFKGPFIVLLIIAEQGSAKSFTMRKCRALVDPNVAAVRRLPRDDRDLMISAINAWMLCYDNISYISKEMSDALCSLATGAGFGTRELFTNDEEKLMNAARPLMLNGIDDFATRGDLLDRSIILNLPTIPEAGRREEKDLDREFEIARPRILGALLTAVCAALANSEKVVLARKPRMIDFARFAVAAETALGWKAGTFIDAYMRNRADGVSVTLENSVIAEPLIAMTEACKTWEGTTGVLLALLERVYVDEATMARKDWPKNPTALAMAIKRIAPALRSVGVDVQHEGRKPGGKRERLISLTKIAPPGTGDGTLRDTLSSERCPYESDRESAPEPIRDTWDTRDTCLQTELETGGETADSAHTREASNTCNEVSQPSHVSRNPIGGAEEADSSGHLGTRWASNGTAPRVCFNCKNTTFWHRFDATELICGKCTPPSDPTMATWIGTPNSEVLA